MLSYIFGCKIWNFYTFTLQMCPQIACPRRCKVTLVVVNCPTRWSLSFIFVFLCWSSSWRLGPHIEGGRLLWPLLKAGMTVLTQFFCKMYFLYVSRGRKNFLGEILWVLPLQKPFFSQPLGPVLWAPLHTAIFAKVTPFEHRSGAEEPMKERSVRDSGILYIEMMIPLQIPPGPRIIRNFSETYRNFSET